MDKKGKTHLTNEQVALNFKSNFDLVNYAIKLAENMIKTGREVRVKSDLQNRAMLVLQEIREGKDVFDEVVPTESKAHMELDVDEVVGKHIVFDEEVDGQRHEIVTSLE